MEKGNYVLMWWYDMQRTCFLLSPCPFKKLARWWRGYCG